MFFSRATQPNLAREIERYGAARPAGRRARDARLDRRRSPRRRRRGDRPDPGRSWHRRTSPRRSALRVRRSATGERTASDALDVTAARVDRLGWTPIPRRSTTCARSWWPWAASPLERCSVLPLLWDMVELEYSPADVFVDVGELLADGTKSLIDPMAAGLDIRFGTVVTRVSHDDAGVHRHARRRHGHRRGDGGRGRAPAERLERRRRSIRRSPSRSVAAADQRHPGQVSKVLAVVPGRPDRPTSAWGGTHRSTPASCCGPPARTACSWASRCRTAVDLSDHDAVAAAVNAHLPEATVDHHRRPRLGGRPLLPGDLALGAAHLVQRRHVRRAGRARGPPRVRGFGHRPRGRRLDRRRGGQWCRGRRSRDRPAALKQPSGVLTLRSPPWTLLRLRSASVLGKGLP